MRVIGPSALLLILQYKGAPEVPPSLGQMPIGPSILLHSRNPPHRLRTVSCVRRRARDARGVSAPTFFRFNNVRLSPFSEEIHLLRVRERTHLTGAIRRRTATIRTEFRGATPLTTRRTKGTTRGRVRRKGENERMVQLLIRPHPELPRLPEECGVVAAGSVGFQNTVLRRGGDGDTGGRNGGRQEETGGGNNAQAQDDAAQRDHRHRGQHHRVGDLRVARGGPDAHRERQRSPDRLDGIRRLLHGELFVVIAKRKKPGLKLFNQATQIPRLFLIPLLLFYQVFKYDVRISFLKNTNSKKCFIQSKLHRLLYIFPIFRAICEYYASKNLPLLLRTIDQAIFSHLRTNLSAAQRVRDVSMQTSGNRKEPSLVSKPQRKNFRAECFGFA